MHLTHDITASLLWSFQAAEAQSTVDIQFTKAEGGRSIQDLIRRFLYFYFFQVGKKMGF